MRQTSSRKSKQSKQYPRDPYELKADKAAQEMQRAIDDYYERHKPDGAEIGRKVVSLSKETDYSIIYLTHCVLNDHYNQCPPRPPKPSFVYFADVDGHCKIGLSENVANRMQSLRYSGKTGSVRLLAFADGNRDDEKRMHRFLKASRYSREYFSFSPSVSAVVAFVRRLGKLPREIPADI